ncbi:site-specific integrase [Pseudonocardia sp. N23]|uniref:tyrosine-type recombinase/integrase n=1 Tax=Pseudonocardia sp. N23 TaxID=1987376 RepID=UPI000BFC18AD|nr:site-specific integrase [Pseudonocardia sp. N23]
MASTGPRRRARGNITWLSSGSARVSVYAGVDQLTGKQIRLRETVAARATRRETEREAQKVQTRLLNQVDDRRSPRTEATVNELLDRWLDVLDIERKTRAGYVSKIEKHVRPTIGRLAVGRVKVETVEGLYGSLRRCRDHCRGRKFVQHRTEREHVCDEHSSRRRCAKDGESSAPCRWCERVCRQHVCTPLSAGSIRVVHAILSGAFRRGVRWGWISTSPIDQVEAPSVPRPNPAPPSADEAADLLTEAWKDPDWGTFVWFTMTTGARRGEVCGLRWNDLDLSSGVATFRSSIGQIAGVQWEKDPKTHQHRRVTLDPELVEVLVEHRGRCDDRARAVDTKVRRDGFVFSPVPDCGRQTSPDTVTQRYGRMATRLGIRTHLHCLRHYSATELIAAGVDIRTVAGRLGHAGGGATTLRTYTAFVLEADQRAASALAARRPRPRRSLSGG